MGGPSRRGILVEADGAWHLFCDRTCAWLYFAYGRRSGEKREGVKWGCLLCARGILEDDD